MTDYELLDIRTLPDPEEDGALLKDIPEWRRAYILRYNYPEDRKRSLGVWILMEKMLMRYGFSANAVTVGEKGKPTCEGIYFNLSHSGDMALCAVSDTPVGCDIEMVRNAPLDVVKRFFTLKERQYLDAAQGDDINRRFFRLWTMKESYLKMTGEGLSFPMDRLEIDPVAATVFRNCVPQPCKIQNTVLDGYEISICFKI